MLEADQLRICSRLYRKPVIRDYLFFFRKKPLLIKPHVFYKKLIAEIIFLHWHKLKKFKTVLEIAPKT